MADWLRPTYIELGLADFKTLTSNDFIGQICLFTPRQKTNNPVQAELGLAD
jgi:hypothetical protein